MSDFGLQVETRIGDDLDARLEAGDWSFDRSDAETYAAAAGQAGGAAACAALGLAVASPLCAQVGGAIVGWLVGAVWDTFSDFFGGGSSYEERYQKAVGLILAAGAEAWAVSLGTLRGSVESLYRFASAAGLGALSDADLIALLRRSGALLEPCTPARAGQWPCEIYNFDVPDAGTPGWLARVPKWITPSSTPEQRAAAAPYLEPDGQHVNLTRWAQDVQGRFVESLHQAERKAAASLLATGAAIVAEQAAGVQGEGEGEGGSNGAGAGAALGVVALLGLGVLLARRRAA